MTCGALAGLAEREKLLLVTQDLSIHHLPRGHEAFGHGSCLVRQGGSGWQENQSFDQRGSRSCEDLPSFPNNCLTAKMCCSDQPLAVRPSFLSRAGLPVSPLISRLLIRSQVQNPLELRPKANWKFRPRRGGRANPHKTSEWKQKCALLKKKRERERKRGRNPPLHPCTAMSLHSKHPLHLPNGHLAAQAGVSQPCPHVPSQGQAPARHPLPPPAAGEGLTPSSCSPDAGSGIHICVIINLRVSVVMGGRSLCPPSSIPPPSRGAAAKRGGAGGVGQQPRCCGIPSDRLPGR